MSKNSPKQATEAIKEWLQWMKSKTTKNITPYRRQVYTYEGRNGGENSLMMKKRFKPLKKISTVEASKYISADDDFHNNFIRFYTVEIGRAHV